jgi:large subunit ribosomal protein L21
MYAIIATGGKQYRAAVGDTLYIEKLDAEAQSSVTFDRVIAVMGDTPAFGAPYIDGAKITATVEKNGKAKKVIVYKMNRRKGYRRKMGHRQPYTRVRIDKISV